MQFHKAGASQQDMEDESEVESILALAARKQSDRGWGGLALVVLT